jgi:hypothetical protein
MSNIDSFLSRLEKVRQTAPGRWIACCPAHRDKSPSLGIKLEADGKITFNCLASCGGNEVLAAIGFNPADLYPKKVSLKPKNGNEASMMKAHGFEVDLGGAKQRFSKSDLFDILTFESCLLATIVDEMLGGKRLPPKDIDRARESIVKIKNITYEVRR